MKKYLQIALMIFCVSVVFTSCKDDDNNDDAIVEAYKLENEQAFQAKGNDPDFLKMSIQGAGDNFVYAKKLKEGNEPQIPIYYNSRVTVYYKGWLIDSKKDEPFDQCVPYAEPVKFAVSAASSNYNSYTGQGIPKPILGWTIALQHMKVGEIWEVWIPQQLAYGSAEQDNIPAYSTLIFEIEVVERTSEVAGTDDKEGY
ncbi:FKBP-type peptidyl-prolyl cis-trans isomerase [Parabacteroides sp. TM07-1AC]|jgi:peptidylprolyl isomerase/FKBP-type peptidyl-prolyl cis-trans isomerase FklB|uniref:FKBP-type peptidyl-prolyl cis-trans isomerase n=1 Tax=Parabacteroides sp. TM07-1AC TaxID=2292363 RepID=UPI000F005FD1|nr:FKBP-type peptidyl-prolyl cis-trans isomerase [Parabacteroides sp. TM07-1AC]RHU25674.1 FKBP-type peptidyl-prolyl cis-trans isomerase [Parabacteroides sp. TM07-1AC]